MKRATLINLFIGLVLVGANIFFFTMKFAVVTNDKTKQYTAIQTDEDASVSKYLVDDIEELNSTFRIQVLANQEGDTAYMVQQNLPYNTPEGRGREWIDKGRFDTKEKANLFRIEQIHKIIKSERKAYKVVSVY
jgi:hypothetical protein